MVKGKERFYLVSILIVLVLINFVCALTGSIGPAKIIFNINSSEEFNEDFIVTIYNHPDNGVPVIVQLSVSESISDFIGLSEENLTLNPGNSQEIDVSIIVPEGGGDYDGEIVAIFSTQPEENTTQQSITVSSQIIILDEITFVCGDDICSSGENCSTCVEDCGACPPVCGDGVCEGGEVCDVCVADCGACPSGGGGGSSGGGGGGGGGATTDTYIINEDQLKDYTTKSLSKDSRFKLIFPNETHYVKVDEITISYAQITVSSDPQTFNLYLGNEKKVDLNNDNIYDLSIILKNIIDNKAEIAIKGISEVKTIEIASEETKEQIEDETISSEENQEITSSGITGAVIGFVKTGKSFVLIIAFLIISGGIAITILNRKKWKKQ